MTRRGKVGRRRYIGSAALVLTLFAASCASDDASSSDSATSASGNVGATAGSAEPDDDASDSDSDSDSDYDSDSGASEGSDGTAAVAADDCNAGDRSTASEAAVELEVVSNGDGPEVRAAVYPVPDHEGNPWSQWGQGVMLPDGRFVSAVGDHLGRDGNSWVYEYDPATGMLERTAEVSAALGHQQGDWGYGKVHAPMLVRGCGEIVTSTYWGTRRDLQLGGSYEGDHLIRYDPATRTVESLGVPVPGHGLPSLAMSPDGRWVFGEAVDPESEPDAGVFFVADAESGEVVYEADDDRHRGFRSILVSPAGEAFYAIGGGDLVAVDADGNTREVNDVLSGGWLRASTASTADGSVYGTTRDPDALFRLSADGDFSSLGPVEDYVASLAVAPDGETLYYVPGAHGSGADFGTPLVAVDIESGDHEIIVNLNDLIEPALGVTAGGTYNVVVDPSGERLYIGLNSGPPGEFGETFGTVVLAVVELP
ncbi:MAG: hypothetical protein QNM02_09240 [Acidimicrobiia bacterium]|nr:hypothetical protein [Acidimicrobiia bacterium]